MLQLLETGWALYVLAGICVLGLLTRMMTRNLYKRLVKESANLATAKNKSLKELKQRAENAYRMNQGMRDSGVWLEHQLSELHFRGTTLAGWSNLSMQLTWLCLLAGGTAAFFSYWYRLDTYYVVMYGGGAILMAMLTMLFDNGTAGGWKDQLVTVLQDYLENVMYPRLVRNQPEDNGRADSIEQARTGVRGIGRQNIWSRQSDAAEIGARTGFGAGERSGAMETGPAGTPVQAAGPGGASKRRNRRETAAASNTARMDGAVQAPSQDVDYLKHSLEQIAASREKNRSSDGNWLKDLGPDEVQVIGDILKQYLA